MRSDEGQHVRNRDTSALLHSPLEGLRQAHHRVRRRSRQLWRVRIGGRVHGQCLWSLCTHDLQRARLRVRHCGSRVWKVRRLRRLSERLIV